MRKKIQAQIMRGLSIKATVLYSYAFYIFEQSSTTDLPLSPDLTLYDLYFFPKVKRNSFWVRGKIKDEAADLFKGYDTATPA